MRVSLLIHITLELKMKFEENEKCELYNSFLQLYNNHPELMAQL